MNHRTADLATRERLARATPALAELLEAWARRLAGFEVVHLSTCNRFEVYLACAAADLPDPGGLADEVAELLGVEPREALYLHEGEAAARHLFRVASSLDSQVLGEDQILAQVRAAYHASVEDERTGPVLNHLFHAAFRVGKKVRTETGIGRNPVSLASAAVRLARKVFGDLTGRRVLAVGVGEMTRLALVHLQAEGAGEVVVANRTTSRGAEMAAEFGGRAVGLDGLDAALAEADLVVAATGAEQPVVGAAAVREALAARGGDPLLLVDLGVPRDVDPAVDELEGAFLYDLEALEQITEASRAQRAEAAVEGERIAEDEARGFQGWLDSRKVTPVIQELLDRARGLARRELLRSMKGVDELSPEAMEACERAVVAAVEKVLHHPVISLRKASGVEERTRTVEAVRHLFRLRVDEEVEPALPEVAEGGRP